MKALLASIRDHAERQPRVVAVGDELGKLNYRGLAEEVERVAPLLDRKRAGLLLENGRHWAVTDLALAQRGALCVPMPAFFSDSQLGHLLRDADLDLIVTDNPGRIAPLLGTASQSRTVVAGRALWLFRRHSLGSPGVPEGTAKVTYTSGTTGEPKGVCLNAEAMERTAISLGHAVGAGASDRALSLLPLAILLENIGGLYAPLYAGASAQVPALGTCGLEGSSALRTEALFAALQLHAPTTLILVPQLLKALVGGIAAGLARPQGLRFVAVGGAPVSAGLLAQAREQGIPVYEGYGLSEAGSVVCLNLPGADRPGSVGRPLPHARIALDAHGEVLVETGGFLGYLGGQSNAQGFWPTGDLGRLDADGFLHLIGRRKSAYATAFGRNVAPEWVEGALTAHPDIAQAAVFGEGRPYNVAVIVPQRPQAPAWLAHAVRLANASLPDYARVSRWILAAQPFTRANGLVSSSGALRRDDVGRRYRDQIEQLYEGETQHVAL